MEITDIGSDALASLRDSPRFQRNTNDVENRSFQGQRLQLLPGEACKLKVFALGWKGRVVRGWKTKAIGG